MFIWETVHPTRKKLTVDTPGTVLACTLGVEAPRSSPGAKLARRCSSGTAEQVKHITCHTYAREATIALHAHTKP